MTNKFYVTTPVYYPNDIPHIGHAYTTIAADILARWNKLSGKEVFFLTGTDEHGKKIENVAKEKGKKPREFIDELVPKFKEAWKKLNIDYDFFIRTTDKEHEKVVKDILQKVYDKGDIYLGEYSGYYCTGCEAYYTEKDLIDGCCPIHKKPIEILKEKSYFFKLSKYEKKLLDFYKKNSDFISPKNRQKEVINRVKEGLKDLSISRTSFDWGIKLPFDKGHIAFVWFDALLNYYSATRIKGREHFWPADVHLIGKDIIWFHAVYWPAMLMSAGIELPKKIFAHGWWTFNNEKISKSRGKVINIDELISIAGVDSARYFLFRETPFGDDGDFSEQALIDRHNNELADKLGNLVSRVSALIEKYGIENVKRKIPSLDSKWKKLIEEGKIKSVDEILTNDFKNKIYTITNKNKNGTEGLLLDKYLSPRNNIEIIQLLVKKQFENYEFDKVLNTIFAFIDVCNEYIQNKKPWETKDNKVLYELADSIKAIAILLSPFIPSTSEKIAKQFGFKISLDEIKKPLNEKNKISKGEILFRKI